MLNFETQHKIMIQIQITNLPFFGNKAIKEKQKTSNQ